MKISQKTQRRTIVFVVASAIIALFQIAHYGVQLTHSTNPYVGDNNHTFIGKLDTKYQALDIKEGYEQHAIVIERDAKGKPLVEALPTGMMLFSKHPDYQRPDHYGWKMNVIVIYAALALLVVIVILMARILISAIKGFRTGNIFQHRHVPQLRWLALAMFLYYAMIDNRELFRMIALKDIYGDSSPIELFGYATLNAGCIIAPLLLLALAELMAIAAKINEDESMTI